MKGLTIFCIILVIIMVGYLIFMRWGCDELDNCPTKVETINVPSNNWLYIA